MDVLSDVLSWFRVNGTITRRSRFFAPWAIAYPPTRMVSFMIVEKGRCFVQVDGQAHTELEAGELMMFSPGRVSALGDHPSTPTVPYSQVLEQFTARDTDRYALNRGSYPTITHGGEGKETVIRGMGLRLEGNDPHVLLSLLPPVVHITNQQRSTMPQLETTIRFLLREAQQHEEGAEMMIARLVELLFVQIIRAWFREQPAGEAGWLGALRDKPIGHALKLIHRYPAEPWTVGSLARAVGMSRSGFSSRFRTLVGVSPLKYLTQLRMTLAGHALQRDTSASLNQIAAQVGYDNESSFGRAFKRHHQKSPGAFRNRKESSPPHT